MNGPAGLAAHQTPDHRGRRSGDPAGHIRVGDDRAIAQRPGESAGERSERIGTVRSRCAALAPLLLPDDVRRRVETASGVYVTGLELLGNPPIEILPFGTSDLGRERAVSRLPSLPVGVALARAPIGRTEGFAMLAAPEPSSRATRRFASLARPFAFGAEDERVLSAACAGHRVRFLTGRDATFARLGDADVSGATMLAIVTHGVRDPELELPAGLAFAMGLTISGIDFDFSPQAIYRANDDMVQYAEDFKQTFGYDEAVILIVLEATG